MARKIFAIQHKNTDYYPAYAPDFGPQSVKPKPAIKEIIEILNTDAWSLAYWFASVNGFLEGRAAGCIETDPDLMTQAAKDAGMGMLHG